MSAMDLDRLRAILDAYGAARHRWPAAERASAEALIATSAEAQAAVAEAAALDRQLDALAPPMPLASAPVDTDLRNRILAAAASAGPPTSDDARVVPFAARPAEPLSARRRGGVSATWRAVSGFALAASLMLGVATGSLVAVDHQQQDADLLLNAAQFTDSYDGF